LRCHFFHTSLYDLACTGRTANLFLSSALAVIVLKTGGITPFLLPVSGPLLYLYVRKQTWPECRWRWKDMLHFFLLAVALWVPAWLVLIAAIIYLCTAHRLIEDFYRRLQAVLMGRPRLRSVVDFCGGRHRLFTDNIINSKLSVH
jgi:putative ABC transport system permease protein